MSDHVLITTETCPCKDGRDDILYCPVCDSGLAICSLCGRAEIQLDEPCTGGRYTCIGVIGSVCGIPHYTLDEALECCRRESGRFREDGRIFDRVVRNLDGSPLVGRDNP